MENNVLNTNKGIKSFFENNWLSLLLILGVAIAFYFGYQRITELNQRNSDINDLLQDQRESIEENHTTIDNLNRTVIEERAAREALRIEYQNFTELSEVWKAIDEECSE